MSKDMRDPFTTNKPATTHAKITTTGLRIPKTRPIKEVRAKVKSLYSILVEVRYSMLKSMIPVISDKESLSKSEVSTKVSSRNG